MTVFLMALAFAATLSLQSSLSRPATWLAPVLLALLSLLPQHATHSKSPSLLVLVSGLLLSVSSLMAGQNGGETYLALASVLALGVLCGQSLNRHEQGSKALTLALAVWAGIQAAYSLYQMIAFYSQALPNNPVAWRPWGSYLTPNLMAGALLLWLPYLGYQATHASTRLHRILSLSGVFLGAFAFLSARSRGATLALLGAGLMVLAYRRVWARWILLLVGMGLAWHISQSSLTHLLADRFLLWVPAYHAWLQSPWLGHGPAMWLDAYQLSQEALGFGVGQDPHQALLSILISGGLLALLLLLPLGLWVLANLHRSLGSAGKSGANVFLSWGILASLLHAQVEMSILLPIWLLALGLALGLLQSAPADLQFKVALARPKRLSLGSLFILAIVVGYHGGLEAWSLPLGLFLTAIFWAKLEWAQSTVWNFDRWDFLAIGLAFSPLLGVFTSIQASATLQQVGWGLLGGLAWLSARHQVWQAAQAARMAAWLSISLALFFVVTLASFGSLAYDTRVARWFFPNDNILAGGIFVPGIWLCLFVLPGKVWHRGVAILALATAISMTGSRGALLALLASAIWIVFRLAWAKSSRSWQVPALALILGAAIYALPWPGNGFQARFAGSPSRSSDPLLYGRGEFWRLSIQGSLQRPLLGWGPGSYAMAMEHLPRPKTATEGSLAKQALRLDHAHHDWLEAALERGWLIVGLFGLLVIYFLKFRLSQALNWVGLSLEATFIAWLVQSNVDTVFHTPALGLASAMVLGWLWLPQAKTKSVNLNLVSQPVFVGLFASLLAMSGILSYSPQTASPLSKLDPQQRVSQIQHKFQVWQKDGRLLHAKEALEAAVSFYQFMPEDYRAHVWLQRVGTTILANSDSATIDNIARLLPTWIPGSKTQGKGSALLKDYLVASLQRSSRAFPEKASLRFQNALSFWSLGLGQEASNELSLATSLEPNFARAWQWQAKAAQAKHDLLLLKQVLARLHQIHGIKQQIDAHPLLYDAYTRELVTGADWPWIFENIEKYRISNRAR